MPASCVCIGGVNYTKACSCKSVQCCCCGGGSLAMSTVHPNPAVNQSVGGNCGGASCLSQALNAIGKWGTAITGMATNKPVVVGAKTVAVGASGTTLGGMSGNSLLLILLVVGVLIFVAMRK